MSMSTGGATALDSSSADPSRFSRVNNNDLLLLLLPLSIFTSKVLLLPLLLLLESVVLTGTFAWEQSQALEACLFPLNVCCCRATLSCSWRSGTRIRIKSFSLSQAEVDQKPTLFDITDVYNVYTVQLNRLSAADWHLPRSCTRAYFKPRAR